MEDRKYILTNETKEVNGHILHRIQAVREFRNVKKGDFGGWIEKEENLSHEGLCWVGGEACVYGDAWVYDDAQVFGNARIYKNARVYGDVWVCGNSKVYGDARIYGDALVYGDAQIFENARIYGDAQIYGDALVHGNIQLWGREKIYTGKLNHNRSYLCLGPIGSRNGYTTFFLAGDKIMVTCGCFKGDISEFEAAVHKTHVGTEHEKDYIAAIQYVKFFLK